MLFNLIHIFENFRYTDLFDILMVSLILYQFFSILQGTRAVRILVGVFGVTVLYWLSLAFELYGLTWLLKHFFDYFFVILIIIFQEEIRSALAKFGKTRLIFKRTSDFYSEQIEEVVTACVALGREKIGALIVFEKGHGLLNYSLTGTKLDSKVHSDIIYSLFQVSSPLHDGAIILFQDRIQAAGCFLPLSKKHDLDRQFGTRHRAALGLSEVADAVTVVVSEESGKISVCMNGEFFYCATETQLRKQLRLCLFSKKEKLNNSFVNERRA